jgi:folate-dependent tRNA-U54 methylase TrmFO/GidA
METLRYGPMKPVGLTDPRTARRPCGDRKRKVTARALADLDAWLGARRAAE